MLVVAASDGTEDNLPRLWQTVIAVKNQWNFLFF